MYLYLSIYLSRYLFIYLSIYPSIHPPRYLSIYLARWQVPWKTKKHCEAPLGQNMRPHNQQPWQFNHQTSGLIMVTIVRRKLLNYHMIFTCPLWWGFPRNTRSWPEFRCEKMVLIYFQLHHPTKSNFDIFSLFQTCSSSACLTTYYIQDFVSRWECH